MKIELEVKSKDTLLWLETTLENGLFDTIREDTDIDSLQWVHDTIHLIEEIEVYRRSWHEKCGQAIDWSEEE